MKRKPMRGAAPAAKRSYRGPAASFSSRSRIYGRPGITEVKSFDQEVAQANLIAIANVTGQEPAAFTSLTEINLIRQGAAFYQRIGSKIVMKSISVDFNINASATTPQVSVRSLIIYDRQPNGAFPATTDIFLDNAGGQTFGSGLNIANKSRFLILRDQYKEMDTAQGLVYHVKMFCKARLETEYKGDAGTIADIATGAVYLVVFKGTQTGAGNIVCQDINTRIRYYD